MPTTPARPRADRRRFRPAAERVEPRALPAAFSVLPVPTPAAQPGGVVVTPDGAAWITEAAVNQLGRVAPGSAAVTEFTSLGGNGPSGITFGPDGNLWVTFAGSSAVGRFNLAGGAVGTPIPTASPAASPRAITTGPDGASLWFAEPGVNRVGRVSSAGVVGAETPVLGDGANPSGIVSGPDGGVWVALAGADRVVRIDPTTTDLTPASTRTFAAGVAPTGLARAGDGILWATLAGAGRLAAIDPAPGGPTVTYAVPSGGAPGAIAAAADGQTLWFTESNAPRVGRVTRDGRVTEYSSPAEAGPLGAIAAGPGGVFWMTAAATDRVVRLDTTQLLAVTAQPVSAVAGAPFTGTAVGTFTTQAVNPQAGDYTAVVNWGDNTQSAATLRPTATPGVFDVLGGHTYARSGNYTVTVGVTDGAGLVATGTSAATVTAPELTVATPTLAASAGSNVNAVVATFTSATPGATASSFIAVIDWGDGTPPTRGEVKATVTGTFSVTGSHTYALPGSYPLIVAVTDNLRPSPSFATGTGAVSGAFPLSGRLNPVSDSGVVGDNITNVSRPLFTGQATPYAVVQLSAVLAGSFPTSTRPLGQAIAGGDGSWTVASNYLPDGIYTVLATQTPPARSPSQPIPIVGTLQIDTVGPRVAGVTFAPQNGVVSVAISDAGAGLGTGRNADGQIGPNSPLNVENYTIAPNGFVAGFNPGQNPTPAPSVSGFYSSATAFTVRLSFVPTPSWFRHVRASLFQVKSGGIADLAGNPLDGEFTGRLPSGNGAPGGNFLMKLVTPRLTPRPVPARAARRV